MKENNMKDMTVGAAKKALRAAFPERTFVVTVQDWVSYRVSETLKYKLFSITMFHSDYHLVSNLTNPCEQYSGKTLREAFDALMAKESELAMAKETEISKCA
jgi:hypothetical protein